MDYFYAGSPHGNTGLQDIYIKMKYTIGKLTCMLDVHSFSALAPVKDKTLSTSGNIVSMNANLGIEPDLTLKYKMAENSFIQLGYSQMWGTATLQALKGGNYHETNNWAYLMLVFKPVFHKS